MLDYLLNMAEMDGHVACEGENGNAYKNSDQGVGTPEGMRFLGRHWHRWGANNEVA
jgi:hypothetical protein